MPAADDDFLRYYLEELSYLRHMGQRFARDYPKVAGRLELQPDDSADPHVERLIESFAFLTARIQSDLANDFPEIAAELLNVLYPHYLNPIPSMGVARFDFDPERGKLSTGYDIPRHTPLFAVGEQGAVCRWRTAYPVTLWPIEIVEAEIEMPETYEFIRRDANVGAVLRIRLQSRADPFDVLDIERLRFYFHGDASLYELLFHDVTKVAVLSAGAAAPRDLGRHAVRPVGFGNDEELVPYPRHAHPGYRLVQEYFTFPHKFQFADVHGLAGVLGPLPPPVTELVMERTFRKDRALRDFLDIFNHRLVSIFYRARKKYRPALDREAPHNGRVARVLFAFLGLGTPHLQRRMGVNDHALLAYAGLCISRWRPTSGLIRMLEDYFATKVRVSEFHGRWHTLEPDDRTHIGTSRLGQNQVLGHGAVLGSRVWDQAAAFEIGLGPLSLERFRAFLPIGDSFAPLVALVRFYVREELGFTVRLTLTAAEVPELRLRKSGGALLGWTSWLKTRPFAGDDSQVRLVGRR
jgi:type VI secretion system ImpH/TssG family protein